MLWRQLQDKRDSVIRDRDKHSLAERSQIEEGGVGEWRSVGRDVTFLKKNLSHLREMMLLEVFQCLAHDRAG